MTPKEILSEAIRREGTTGVANALGTGKSTVSQWQHGRSEIPPAAVLFLAERLGLPEPNPYAAIAAATKQPKLRDWAEKKARNVGGALVFVISVLVGSLVSPTVEVHGISEADNSTTLCALR